jgi:hypothetical protein
MLPITAAAKGSIVEKDGSVFLIRSMVDVLNGSACSGG